jgi:transcriptional antiterminator NusG
MTDFEREYDGAAVDVEDTSEPVQAVADDVTEALDAREDAIDVRDERPAPAKKDNRNWFVIHTYSGYENKVKANLERRIHSMGMQDKIFRVLVPMEDEVEFKDGKRKITPKKVFPGYVLVEMIMDDQSWYVVRNTQGVTGFVGSPGPGEKPVPLQEKEVKTILKQMGIEAPKLKIDSRSTSRRATASKSPPARSSTSPASSTKFNRKKNACARSSRSSAAKRRSSSSSSRSKRSKDHNNFLTRATPAREIAEGQNAVRRLVKETTWLRRL